MCCGRHFILVSWKADIELSCHVKPASKDIYKQTGQRSIQEERLHTAQSCELIVFIVSLTSGERLLYQCQLTGSRFSPELTRHELTQFWQN